MTLAEEIKKIIKGEVEDSPETLETYSRDASLFYIRPALVVHPKDANDIGALVRFTEEARKNGRNISLTPRSAGTDMTGGPLSESIVINCMAHLNSIKKIGDDYAIVEPGVYYRDFEKETLAHGLILPSYPASRELCAMGGILANNSGGEKTLRYGKTERYAEEIKMILADGNEYAFKKLNTAELEEKKNLTTFEGEVYRNMHSLITAHYQEIVAAKPNVTKNSAGYFLWNVWNKEKNTFDLTKLIVGSQGTLGIITEAKLRLIKPAPASRLLVIFLKNLTPLADIAKIVLEAQPESFESYDDNTFRLAVKFFPDILRRLKGGIFKLILGFLPEAWIVLTRGIPKLVLLVEFAESTEEEAEKKAKAVEKILKEKFSLPTRVTKSREETQEFWIIRRESFNLLRQHVKGLRTAPFIDDFAVEARHLPEFLPKLYAILNMYKLIYTVAGHVGDGNFHIIPLMDLTNPDTEKIITTLSDKVYRLVLSYKGSITAEHNDGLIRSPYLKEMYGEDICRLFEQTKKIFDPYGIFNPGKKVGADLEYALKHLDKKKP